MKRLTPGLDACIVVADMLQPAETVVHVQVTVTAHPASPVSLSANDLLAGATARQLSATALATGQHEWRVLRFNGVTRQSVCRVVAPAGLNEVLPVPCCIATEYLKSMLASGARSLLPHTLQAAVHATVSQGCR